MSAGIRAKALVLALVAAAAFGCDDTPPKQSADDDLRNLKIPENAEKRQASYKPLGDVVKWCDYLVNGEVVGKRQFYKNGRLAEEKLFRDKKLHGYWRQFHQNGKPFSERPYRDGLPDGAFRFWDEKGRLLGESVLKNGTGMLSEFEKADLGSHRDDVPYLNGKIDGKRKRWGRYHITGPNGCNVTEYKDDVMDGWSYLLHDDGTLLAYSYFKQDKLHGVSRRTTRDGKNVKGYPSYRIQGKEVTEEEFREAAETDKILALTLTGKPDVEESEHLQKPNQQGGK